MNTKFQWMKVISIIMILAFVLGACAQQTAAPTEAPAAQPEESAAQPEAPAAKTHKLAMIQFLKGHPVHKLMQLGFQEGCKAPGLRM